GKRLADALEIGHLCGTGSAPPKVQRHDSVLLGRKLAIEVGAQQFACPLTLHLARPCPTVSLEPCAARRGPATAATSPCRPVRPSPRRCRDRTGPRSHAAPAPRGTPAAARPVHAAHSPVRRPRSAAPRASARPRRYRRRFGRCLRRTLPPG